MTNNNWKYTIIANVLTIVIVVLMLIGYHAIASPAKSSQISTTSSPSVIPYQGTLTDANGNPIDGNIDITFSFYDVSSGGTALWTEAHTGNNAVPVNNGLFNVNLGSLNPIPNSIWDVDTLYLGVQIGNDTEMQPREIVGSVPSAMTVPNDSIGRNQISNVFGSSALPLSNVIIQPWGGEIWNGSMGTVTSAFLDFSDKTSPTATAVILHVYAQDADQEHRIRLFRPGETNWSKKQTIFAQSSGMNSMLVIVPCDQAQRVEYETTGDLDSVVIRLLGWIEPAK